MKSCFLLLAFGMFVSFTSMRAEEKPLVLQGIDAKDHTPLVADGKKGTVLFFVSAYCPTSTNFVPEMNRIAVEYAGNFQFYFVHSDLDLKVPDVVQHTELNAIKSTVLLDKDQRLAKLEHAKITPEAMVIGADGKTLYQGRINDWYLGPTKKQRQPTTKDLRDALDAVQSGKPVTNAKLDAVGCKITGVE